MCCRNYDSMNVNEVLKEAGLSDKEILVYLALIKKGPSTANELSKDTKLHRTTVYDFLEKLQDKLLVTAFEEYNTKHFEASNPQRFLDIMDEKQEMLKDILPTLQQLKLTEKEDLKVEILRGKEGFISLWKDILRNNEDYLVLGSADEKYAVMLGETADRFFKKEILKGMKTKVLIHKQKSRTFQYQHLEYRYLPKGFPILTSAIIYGDKVGIHLFEPFSTILIHNKSFAESYRNYFKLLWNGSSKKT